MTKRSLAEPRVQMAPGENKADTTLTLPSTRCDPWFKAASAALIASSVTIRIDNADIGDDSDAGDNTGTAGMHIPRNQREGRCRSPVCRNCRHIQARRRRNWEGFGRTR
jgi:hypothetical protein